LTIVVISLPVPSFLAAGLFVGFMVTFSSCYKQTCSTIEEYAMIWIPALGLLIALPILIIGVVKYQKLKAKIAISKAPWIAALVVSSLIIMNLFLYLAQTVTYSLFS